jgi:hypothetical protein
MKKNWILAVVLIVLTVPQRGATQEGNYLILEDIGAFKLEKESREFPDRKLRPITPYKRYNGSAGVLGGTGHFNHDHNDVTYETGYDNSTVGMGVTVQVTQHAGADSDKWLRHELDEAFRDDLGIPADSYAPRIISGQTILVDSVGGRDYRWQSGNKIITIEYHGSLRTLPEPIEVVQAYLTKHPSTLSALTLLELRSAANKTTWIKDEMDRRLWLCDKWFMQLQLKKVEEKQVYQESVKSMNIFLDYREKYYGLKAADEKNILVGYLNTNNGTGIKAKLKEYKDWWVVNKDKAISL